MHRLNKFVSAIVSVCFLLNTVVSDLALAQTVNLKPSVDKLATSSNFGRLGAVERRDIVQIDAVLKMNLLKLDEVGIDSLSEIRELDGRKISVYTSPDMKFFFDNQIDLKDGKHAAIKCVIKDKTGPRIYWLIADKTVTDRIAIVNIVTSEQYNEADGDINKLLARHPEDAKIMDRDLQHELGIDAVIRYAYELTAKDPKNPVVAEPLPAIFNPKVHLKSLVDNTLPSLFNIKVTNPSGLTPIEDRPVKLIKMTEDIKQMTREWPAKLVLKDGTGIELYFLAHPSDNAFYVFVDEGIFNYATTGEYRRIESALIMKKIIDFSLLHDIGAVLNLPILTADGKNEIDRRRGRLSAAKSPISFEHLELPITSLVENPTRDFADGRLFPIDEKEERCSYIANCVETFIRSGDLHLASVWANDALEMGKGKEIAHIIAIELERAAKLKDWYRVQQIATIVWKKSVAKAEIPILIRVFEKAAKQGEWVAITGSANALIGIAGKTEVPILIKILEKAAGVGEWTAVKKLSEILRTVDIGTEARIFDIIRKNAGNSTCPLDDVERTISYIRLTEVSSPAAKPAAKDARPQSRSSRPGMSANEAAGGSILGGNLSDPSLPIDNSVFASEAIPATPIVAPASSLVESAYGELLEALGEDSDSFFAVEAIMKLVPATWLDGWLKIGLFAAAVKETGCEQNIVIEDNKSTLIFSEKATFGELKDGQYEEGMGVILPSLTKSGIKVAVVATTDKQRALIDMLNNNLPMDQRIIIAESVSEIMSKANTPRYYYFKVGSEAAADAGPSVTSITIIVKKILEALGRVAQITDNKLIDQIHEAARQFAMAA